jgi:membrane protein YdbS with pleckstrin-like domain
MWSSDLTPLPAVGDIEGSLTSKGARLNRNQWVLLIAMFVIWAILVGVFLFVVVRDQWSFIRGLLP